MALIPLTRIGPEDGGEFEFHWSGSFLETHLLSDVGHKRTHNEDCCVVTIPDDRIVTRQKGLLFAVADGMGGVSGGGFASQLALQTLVESYFDGNSATIPSRLQEAVREANHRILEEAESNPEYYGMGTTVSAVVVLGNHAYIAQVGDSRVYLLRNGENIWQITEDHSLVAEQVRNGLLSEEEARSHSLRNLITRAVGTKEALQVDLFSLELQVHDTLMICSDGLSGVVSDEEIAKSLTIRNVQGAARKLVGRALEGGGPDNISVAVIRIVNAPPKTDLQSGAVEVQLTKAGLLDRVKRLFS